MAAPLLAVALCLLAASPVSAADPDGAVVGAQGSDVVRVVDSAQSEVEADPDSDPDRRLVDRESSERIDAVVIALWTIAGVMTVLLALFLWHTSPRRRLRLAGGGAAELSGEAEGGAEPAGEEPGEDEPGADSSKGGFEGMGREALLWLRSRLAPREQSEPVDDSSEQESESARDGAEQVFERGGDGAEQVFERGGDGAEQESAGESVDESAVWKFSEANGERRSV